MSLSNMSSEYCSICLSVEHVVDCVEHMLNTSSKKGDGRKFAMTPGGPGREAASLEIHCFLWDSFFPAANVKTIEMGSRCHWSLD